jgi:hypothetical protein
VRTPQRRSTVYEVLATPIGQIIPFGAVVAVTVGVLSLERYCWWQRSLTSVAAPNQRDRYASARCSIAVTVTTRSSSSIS